MPTRVVGSGAAGRMGRRVVALVAHDPDCQLAGAVEAAGCAEVTRDAGELAGVGKLGVTVEDEFDGAADVLIDFSTPEGFSRACDAAEAKGMALVSGTTGIPQKSLDKLNELSEKIPLIHAPNVSVGVNVLLKVLSEVARAVGEGWDVEIIEAHHRHKADAPSGTALRLAEAVSAALGWKLKDVVCHGRSGRPGERPRAQIGMHAARAGDIVGDHTVLLAGVGERLEFIHRAHSRDTFASGALRAAKFIQGRSPGIYTMAHVLGFEPGS